MKLIKITPELAAALGGGGKKYITIKTKDGLTVEWVNLNNMTLFAGQQSERTGQTINIEDTEIFVQVEDDDKRHSAIEAIKCLFPPDSQYEDTAEIGNRLMKQAMEACMFDWTDLPTDVLIEFQRLCEEFDNNH